MKIGDTVTVKDNVICDGPGVVTAISKRSITVSWNGRVGIYSDKKDVSYYPHRILSTDGERTTYLTHENNDFLFGYVLGVDGRKITNWCQLKEYLWFTKSTQAILKQGGYEPSFELNKAVDSLTEAHSLDAWYFLSTLKKYSEEDILYKNFWFLFNNYCNSCTKLTDISTEKLVVFCNKTKDMPSNDRKEAFEAFVSGGNIDEIVKKFEKEGLDPSVLDFLEGKVTEEKLVNWAVGQVMKAHPKKYNPQEIKEAIMKRWF